MALAVLAVPTGCAAPATAPSSTPAAPIEARAIPVTPRLSGLSPAYAAAFGDPTRLRPLGVDLAGCASDADLTVTYDRGVGAVAIAADWDPACRPIGADPVDLRPLAPIGRALARYRDGLAVGHDPRLAAFGLVVDVDGCRLSLAGQFPPDGTTFAWCPTDRCLPTADGAVTIADPTLAACLAAGGPPGPEDAATGR
ncbi:MAG: hypothetical protein ABMB14_05230 [Myxococcota bacterium]